MSAARAVGGATEPPQDALTYVRAVKSRFQSSKPEVYEAFLEVMRDFKNARCVGFFYSRARAREWRFLSVASQEPFFLFFFFFVVADP